MKQQTHDGRMC